MKNLAGVNEADLTIKEELYLAGIEQVPAEAKGEVPYTIEGRIGNWRLRRAWYYWMVSVELPTDGLLLKDAVELHEKPNPINPDKILGTSIRCGGHCGCPSPVEYGAQPVHDEALEEKLVALGYKKEYSEILKKEFVRITVGEISELCEAGRLVVDQYVTSYHIDDQIGLNEFAKFLNKK